MGVGTKVLAPGGCTGGLCDDRPGAAHARHSQFQTVLLGSKTDTPWGTAGPTSHTGGASAKTCLRKGEKSFIAAVGDRSEKIERNSTVDTKVDEEGWGIKGHLVK